MKKLIILFILFLNCSIFYAQEKEGIESIYYESIENTISGHFTDSIKNSLIYLEKQIKKSVPNRKIPKESNFNNFEQIIPYKDKDIVDLIEIFVKAVNDDENSDKYNDKFTEILLEIYPFYSSSIYNGFKPFIKRLIKRNNQFCSIYLEEGGFIIIKNSNGKIYISMYEYEDVNDLKGKFIYLSDIF